MMHKGASHYYPSYLVQGQGNDDAKRNTFDIKVKDVSHPSPKNNTF